MSHLTLFPLGGASASPGIAAAGTFDGAGAEASSLAFGPRFQAAWDALIYGLSWFFGNLSPAFAFAIAGLTVVIAFIVYYWRCLKPRPHSLEWISMAEQKAVPRQMSLTLPRHPFQRQDIVPMLLVTLIYAVTAFFRLGSLSVPQTYTVFDLDSPYAFSYSQPVTVDKISYYTALGSGAYRLEYSADGVHWESIRLDQSYNTLFKWQLVDLTSDENDPVSASPITASQFRISAAQEPRPEGLWLAELVLWSGDQPLAPDSVSAGGEALFDERELWTTKSTYMNSTYFDEIYHPRTALEHLNNIYPYEVSHPPLGKLIMAAGIWMFGMTPFGWRFMGALFGVLMLPILYLFLKNLFGKTSLAVCGACLFAFDFMHLVQTRIGTIDTYGVFFILLSYYFMYRWLSVPSGVSLRVSIPSLCLSGLFWGIGCACKWTVVYAGIGLALLWLLGLIFKGREWSRYANAEGRPRFFPYLAGTIALSLAFFAAVPLCVYVVSYLPYATAKAAQNGDGAVTLKSLLTIAWDNQVFMLTYHQGVHTPHPYESYWYQWIFDGRPILYYRDLDYAQTLGVKSLFASFNNPLVSWAGLLSFFAVLAQTVRRKCGKGLFILIAILSQFVPWLPIGRILFAYHYFPTILFLVFAICYLMNDMIDRGRQGWQMAVYGFTGACVALYAVFYPALTGLYTPLWYNTLFLRWFPSWPL